MSLDPLTVISALVVLLVIWKLRSVLGQRTGAEKPPTNPFLGRPDGAAQRSWAPRPEAQVVRLPGAPLPGPNDSRWRPHAEVGTPLALGLDAIAGADPTFSVSAFLAGAKIAYERIVTAFATGDKDTLKRLLARDVYDDFAAALSERAKRQEALSTTFVSIDEPTIEAAAVESKTARVELRFSSKQIVTTRDRNGNVMDGSDDRVVDVEDVWAFSRDVTSRDPNWKVVATRSGH